MDQAITALVPGLRQFDEVMMFIDPTSRRKTQSKTLDYKPGAWDAIKLGGFNIRRYPRASYEEALQPPQSAR